MAAFGLKIALKDMRDDIWIRVAVPTEMTFDALHKVIMAASNWQDLHSYEFRPRNSKEVIKVYYEGDWLPNDGVRVVAAQETKLYKFFEEHNHCIYVYDFSDFWECEITLETRYDRYPHDCAVTLENSGIWPPEDCGGTEGYKRLLAALSGGDAKRKEQASETLAQAGWKRFDMPSVNKALELIV